MDSDKSAVVLKLNQPFSTSEPLILVRGLLVPGEYHFRMVVSDGAGNLSQPALVSITVNTPTTTWLKIRSKLASLLNNLSRLLWH